MRYDLIVIGMGLSGLMAAKTAVDAGAKVLVVGKGTGGLCLFTSAIDVMGTLPEAAAMGEALPRWIERHPHHPYAGIGWEGIREALDAFAALFPPPYDYAPVGSGNIFLPTGVGTKRSAYLVPATMRGACRLEKERTLLVGFQGFRDFYAGYAAAGLGCRGENLAIPEIAGRNNSATSLARLLEGLPFREQVAAEIVRRLQGETHVGFPALLGFRDPMEILKDLEGRTKTTIFEIPVLPPSIPGMRIFHRFRQHLIERGATFLLGSPVGQVLRKGPSCAAIEVFHPPVTQIYEADRFILATGRFMGGGLSADEETIREPLLGLPLSASLPRAQWFERSFLGDREHAVHGVGVMADGDLRPLDGRGNPASPNLWIAGTILAHQRWIDEKSREGIEIATGYRAARKALAS
jgi:glycerol-3-phosphate dehydrogenase subunit B